MKEEERGRCSDGERERERERDEYTRRRYCKKV